MTDSALQSLYPVNQIGSDGFNWWIGQVEKDSKDDPKGSGRCKVRIIGLHPQSCSVVEDDDLPWAITMMPVTQPHRPGAIFSTTSKLRSGDWVVGFFMDQDKQQPIIMGTVGRVAQSTKTKTAEKDTADEGCNSFTTFLDDQRKNFDQPAGNEEQAPLNAADAGHPATDGKKRSCSPPITPAMTKGQAAIYKVNTKTNPAGISWCVEKADRCGKDTNLTGTFKRLFSEMLAEVQNNNGKLGTYLVGEISGDLYDMISVGREYVDKAIRVMKTFIANIKGFVKKQIRKAVKAITNALLRAVPGGNSLSQVTEFMNKMLASVGCKMADLGDRLAKWLEDMIFGYLFNLYKSTACQVDKFVGGLINKIQSLMNQLLESILGPLQSILGAIAAPLDMIGQAINKVLNLLGIQCSGPGQKCAKKTKVCTDCSGEEREDFLDKLLKDLSGSGNDWNQYNCDDTKEGTKLKSTEVDFVGGVQNPSRNIIYNITDVTVTEGEKAVFTVTRSGYIDIISSLTYKTRNGTAIAGEDYQEASGTLGFVAGKKSATIEIRTFADSLDEAYEDFYLRIYDDTPGREIAKSTLKRNIARCTIKETAITSGVSSPVDSGTGFIPPVNSIDPASNPDADPFTGNVSIPTGTVDPPTDPTYNVVADKVSVKEGEFVTYTVTTTNVPNGTVLSYQLFGDSITPSDIVSNNLTGTFVIEESTAKVIVGIRKDDVSEDQETLIFSIPGTGASTSVLILSDIDGLSEEEIRQLEDESSIDDTDNPPVLPSVGTIVTNAGGGIISIPVNSPGDRYREAPTVFITGEGYGAQGLALLDPDGFVKEIRVTDPGFGYKINKPVNAELECLIDSFTMIRPGQGYTSTPTVFVNGSKDVADAVINDKGQIISVRIKDRTLTFDEYPEVKILGGGGYGAKFVPSFACVKPDIRVKLGSAKIGTGSYIDCP